MVNLKSGGTDYRPKGDPLDVNVRDFKDKELGKVVPHGIYDPTTNAGWVSVGITHTPPSSLCSRSGPRATPACVS